MLKLYIFVYYFCLKKAFLFFSQSVWAFRNIKMFKFRDLIPLTIILIAILLASAKELYTHPKPSLIHFYCLCEWPGLT